MIRVETLVFFKCKYVFLFLLVDFALNNVVMAYIKCCSLAGKRAFIAGIADDNGYGWAIAKSLAAAGAEILIGTWVPVRIVIQNVCFFVPNIFKY